jgi:hypothetical protein
MPKVKAKKSHPPFEVEEYDFGHVSNRDEHGSVYIHVKFSNDKSMYFNFDFHDFIVFHKRKRTEFYKHFIEIRDNLVGWGSRYYELIENSEEFEFDYFTLFKEYLTDHELTVEAYKNHLEDVKLVRQNNKKNPAISMDQTLLSPEDEAERNRKNAEWEEYCVEQQDIKNSQYEQDRLRLQILASDATDDMYEALRDEFLVKMEHYQKYYPNLMKGLEDNIFDAFKDFETRMTNLMPYNLQDFDENYIKRNSEKALDTEDDLPPSEGSAA